jgi:hypothetical protein
MEFSDTNKSAALQALVTYRTPMQRDFLRNAVGWSGICLTCLRHGYYQANA